VALEIGVLAARFPNCLIVTITYTLLQSLAKTVSMLRVFGGGNPIRGTFFYSTGIPMFSHLRRVFMVLLGVYWLALFLGTHVPITLKTGQGGDKILHFLAYTGLAFLMILVIGGRNPTWRAFVLVLVATLGYGGFDEFSQLLVGRHCDFWDFVADFTGICLGLFAYGFVVLVHQFLSFAGQRTKAEIVAR